MPSLRFFPSILATGLILASLASPAGAQASAYPAISGRSFKGGSAKVVVTGAFRIDQDVPINTQASFGDGEMTWLQFGASGAATPNALLTFGNGEVGVSAGLGKSTAIASVTPGETPQCSGKTDVTAGSVSGQYTCPGVTAYDAGTGKMGKVDMEIRFTATS